MEIGVCILPADVTLGLLQPRSNKEDSICAGIVTTGKGAFVEAGGCINVVAIIFCCRDICDCEGEALITIFVG